VAQGVKAPAPPKQKPKAARKKSGR
jgi:hypothetical protein